MARLVNRQLQIPNGFRFYQPQTKYQSRPYASFQCIVDDLVAHRKANPDVCAKFGLSTDPAVVTEEVDAFNAGICERMGWSKYISGAGGAPVPFQQARRSPLQSAINVAAGAATLVEWLASGAESVSPERANARASICAGCPKNVSDDLTSIFTKPVSEAIRKAYNQRKDWNLSTFHDEKLGVCDICSCPLKLKVHMPIDAILKRLPESSKSALVPECWILAESKI